MSTTSTGTKAYTLNRLISEVSNIPSANARNASSVISALSPRAGSYSAKVEVINSFLNGSLNSVLNGTSANVSGATARTRLLRALRARKRNGSF